MAERADPLQAAARLAVEVDAAARETGGPDSVATVGILDVHPRAVNSIPREAYMEIDVRDIEAARRDQILARIVASAERFGRVGPGVADVREVAANQGQRATRKAARR